MQNYKYPFIQCIAVGNSGDHYCDHDTNISLLEIAFYYHPEHKTEVEKTGMCSSTECKPHNIEPCVAVSMVT